MANNFFGGESDFLKGNLKETIGSGGMSDFLQQKLDVGRKDIGRGARRARTRMDESAGISGFSGINANLSNDLFEAEASQIANLTTGIAGVAQQSESDAIGRLIGVNQFEGGMEFSREQLEETARQFNITTAEGKRQFEKMFGLKERELDAMLDAQGGDFLSVLGNVLGVGAGIVTGGAMGGLASGVGDIFSGFFT